MYFFNSLDFDLLFSGYYESGLISKVPDVDGEGNETMVYVATANLMSDIITIGKADNEDDILLVPGFWAEVMENLETLDDFIADD